MKADEVWLLKRIYEEHLKEPKDQPFGVLVSLLNLNDSKTPRQIIAEQETYNHKRLWYVLEKFERKGWLEYGTSLGSAWITEKGIEKAKEIN